MVAAVVLVELGGDDDVEVITVIRRRVERAARGPGLVKLEPIDTEGVEMAEVIPMRRRAK